MASQGAKLAEALARAPELLEEALRPPDRTGRAARLAEAVRALWPGAGLYACRLEGEGGTRTQALDCAGAVRPHWAAALETWLTDPAASSNGALATERLPAVPELSGHTLLLAPVVCQARPWGALALALPAERPPADEVALLKACADRLASRLSLEQAQEQQEAAEEELQEQTAAADVAEAFGVFLHELGNVLNNVILDLRLLEREIPEAARGRLASVGQLLASVPSQLVAPLMRYRHGRRAAARPVDLNRLAGRIAERARRDGAAVHTDLAPDLPPVAATPGGLGRVLRLLLSNALAVTPAARGPVALRTRREGEGVRLCVEDGGPPVSPEALPQLFEPFLAVRAGQNGLELAVCRSLVRRLQGNLSAVNRPEGVSFLADLPAWVEGSPRGG
jgi:signal transduction histidine kinase